MRQQLMADAIVNTDDILRHLAVRSSTKDSLLITWKVAEGFRGFIHGYRVRYQAIGSAIVQESPFLPSTTSIFDITHLHENTFYDVCLTVITNATAKESCLTAATSTHSLSVALGSTFGAFLALGVVVMFVLLAKWQHYRRTRKLFQQHILTGDSTDSLDEICIVQENGDIEMNCVELRHEVLEDQDSNRCHTHQVSKDHLLTPASSEFSADVVLHGASVCEVEPDVGGSHPSRQRSVLIGLDGSCSYANSFIVTSPSRDSKTGVSYSLLVPISASGVLPFLFQSQQGQGEVVEADRTRTTGSRVRYQQPVVRLKLRKHSTVDYTSQEEWERARPEVQDQPTVVCDQSLDRTIEAEISTSAGNKEDKQETPTLRPTGSDIERCLLDNPTGNDALLPRSNSSMW